MRIPFISLVAAGALALGGCAYGDYGYGMGYGGGYGAYGYPTGYGYPGGYYGDPGYYGYGYGDPYFGWYDDFYYPGTGIYVYDSNRRPHRWNDRQRSYWTNRQNSWTSHQQGTTLKSGNRALQSNWSGFGARSSGSGGGGRHGPRG